MRPTTTGLLSMLALATSVSAAEHSISFQNGVSGYQGAFDRRISSAGDVNGAHVDTSTPPLNSQDRFAAWNHRGGRSDVLIRFDDIVGAGAIPSGATILSATLDLRTASHVGPTVAPGIFAVLRLAVPFDGNSTFDGTFGDGDSSYLSAQDGIDTDNGEADWLIGSLDAGVNEPRFEPNAFYSVDVTRAVQVWAEGGPNLGLAIVNVEGAQTGDWSMHSTGHPDPTYRPRLSVTYTTDPGYRVHELQEGLSGYNGTTDVVLNLLENDNSTPADRSDDVVAAGVDASQVPVAVVDGDDGAGSYDTSYLIHFDTSKVTGRIAKAELLLSTDWQTFQSGDSRGPVTAHQLLTPFNPGSVYDDFAGDAEAMQAANQIGPAVDAAVDILDSELVSLDVTSIVNNWQSGQANNGIYLGAADGNTDSWRFYSSGAADSDLRPLLRITVVVPEPAGGWLLAAVGLIPWRQR
ncbi:hypothetical protein KOR34_48330 [Posidoniimonas corsicana]|uniref:DNRLRE domain-containing protein n=1 Tax=Posidoniimonas corsicana TaxID=1938618 RepID=A0A5C5UXV8_9BACT|nr:DNRLRE domain-containing protein [Posidoniimonas corsicana]TWT30275.1 hypothetical protein KOR34_48330 [Posidoniimonas corsicana]